MCLLLAAHECHADYRLIIAANRDEFYQRPADAAAFWTDHERILGGRDLEGGGSWLAVNRAGGFAAITNVRTNAAVRSPRSRGLIVSDYLNGKLAAPAYAIRLARERHLYEGFNVLVADRDSLVWYSNQQPEPAHLAPGVYGLSNHQLDTPWPKVTRIKADFLNAQSLSKQALITALFDSLYNEDTAADEDLPDTGVGLTTERVLAPIFISGETYGTRCSTVVLIGYDDVLTFVERRFGPAKTFLGETSLQFEIGSAAT